MVKIIPYNPKLKALARKLRKDMTFFKFFYGTNLKKINSGDSILTGNAALIII